MSVQTTDIQEPQPLTQRSPWWAIALAVLITVSINAIIPYTHHYMHTISLVEGMIPMGIFMPFLVLIFIVNPVLRALGYALQPWELIFIFAVGYVSMSINELLGARTGNLCRNALHGNAGKPLGRIRLWPRPTLSCSRRCQRSIGLVLRGPTSQRKRSPGQSGYAPHSGG